MKFNELAEKRYSCRKFSDKPVTKEELEYILEAARLAPTARNSQPVRLKLITSSEDREALKECSPCHFDAPLAILVCFDKNECWKSADDGRSSGFIDASIVHTHIMLACSDIGLGSTWVLKFDPVKTKQTFNIPDNLEMEAFLMVGHPAEDAEPSPRHFDRKKIDEILI